MSRWFQNGRPVATVAIDERAFQYGDGLFETIAVRNGMPRLWNAHLQRLAAGCRRLDIEMPDVAILRRWVEDALKQSDQDVSRCCAKVIVSAGVSQRGYGRAGTVSPQTIVGVFPGTSLPAENYRDGVDTIVCDTRLAMFSVTAGLKTLNRIEQVLANSECIAQGAFEGFTRDADGRVICGTMSNVFMVSGKDIVTPSLHRCGVNGVMRGHTMESLKKNRVTVEVRDIDMAELLACDEVFLTNSQFGVLPVRRCGEKLWRSHEVTKNVMAIMADSGVEECAQ